MSHIKQCNDDSAASESSSKSSSNPRISLNQLTPNSFSGTYNNLSDNCRQKIYITGKEYIEKYGDFDCSFHTDEMSMNDINLIEKLKWNTNYNNEIEKRNKLSTYLSEKYTIIKICNDTCDTIVMKIYKNADGYDSFTYTSELGNNADDEEVNTDEILKDLFITYN